MRWCSSFSFERSCHLRCGSITVSGSSNMIDVDVRADQPAAERDLLLAVGGQARGARAPASRRGRACRRSRAPGPSTLRLGHAAVAQRKGEIVVDGHRVVDDRELEHLRDVALVGRHVGHVHVAEEDAPCRRPQESRDDVEQRGLAAAGRAEQRVGAAVRQLEIDLASAPSRRRRAGLRPGSCAGGPFEADPRHLPRPRRPHVRRDRLPVRREIEAPRDVQSNRAVSPTSKACTPCDWDTHVSPPRSKWITLSEPLISAISTLPSASTPVPAPARAARDAAGCRRCSGRRAALLQPPVGGQLDALGQADAVPLLDDLGGVDRRVGEDLRRRQVGRARGRPARSARTA